ncbi:Prolyl tripeptidyl peptidase precursor [Stieleria maiorica]|uniref:Prolyl tripeptidyl peptidase n=1 Tax=Stieleria maiorica TaxID=2795974 RepID=A0A5B9M8P1_9BACT|nr:DPP IV N-terminal domain-containing protein [Stieleria maiorica]QEF97561.1 Prolyl tripeptidyl peptidase precursor [Stieleria maiorica]
MHPRHGFPVAILSLMSLTAFTLGELAAHPPGDSTWVAEAEPRLRAIYEDREFRAEEFQGEWLDDSSGYTIRRQDSDTGQESLVKVDLISGQQTEIESPKTKSRPRRRMASPDGRHRLEVRDQSIFVHDQESGQHTALVHVSPDRDVSFHDVGWSPNGTRVVFVESDATDVPTRPMLVPDDPSYPSVTNRRFARVGETINALRVGVAAVDGGETKWLSIGPSGDGIYLGQVEWAGNSHEVLVEKLSRFRDERVFLLAGVDGEVKEIFRETDSAWAVGSQGKNSGLTWVRDGQSFIVLSEKDGWRHAFLYSRSGKPLALLTPGEYDVIDRAIVDEPGGWYYFYAAPDDGPRKYLYRVPLDGSGTLQRITPTDQPGTHDYDFSPDAKWAFHSYSTIDQPPVTDLVEMKGHRVVRVLEENRQLRGRAKAMMERPAEFIQLDVGQNVSMDAWMIKPKDFDASKKYPVFVYVYGEPYAQTVLDQWGAAQNHFHRVIADLGYLVVSIDNRGTPAPKGAAWRRSIFGSLGPLSTEDQAVGLKELARMRDYVDLSRVGIWGWSGGGSNTLNAMFRKPDDYHVGIAVVPKPQPHLYNAWFQEIYMRDRRVNPDGYERSAPINFADGLKGDLLIVTGSGETNTHIQIIEGLVDRLIELGKRFDYMVYPNRDHGLREGRGSELHVRMLIARYLVDHLPRGPR